jgi:cellulose synthase/poly-beta-1,6-N-acetylglucosamine synthase-like glycosyltransferase
MTSWSIGVVIPARDEAERLPACLEAVRLTADRLEEQGDRVSVVVVADSCRDATATLARAFVGGRGIVLEVALGSAGAARAAGARAYLSQRAGRRGRRDALATTWLASTDADTVVPETWLEHQLGLARLGVAGVAGIVAVDSFADHPPHVPARWSELYDGPGDAPHPHIHGANLGVRADAYLAVGGWSSMAAGEDRQLWGALQASGYRVTSPRSLVVTTSGRPRSWVQGGFADSLNVLGAAS